MYDVKNWFGWKKSLVHEHIIFHTLNGICSVKFCDIVMKFLVGVIKQNLVTVEHLHNKLKIHWHIEPVVSMIICLLKTLADDSQLETGDLLFPIVETGTVKGLENVKFAIRQI